MPIEIRHDTSTHYIFVPGALLPLVRVIRARPWEMCYSPIHPDVMALLCTDKELALDKNATLFDVEEEHSLENSETERAPRNRTLELSDHDRFRLRPLLMKEAPKGARILRDLLTVCF